MFETNVKPTKFGKGGSEPEDWSCLCGYTNLGRRVKKVAGRVVCWMCGVDKDTVDLAKRINEYAG